MKAQVIHTAITVDEAGMRLDRWFKTHYPELTHVQLQKLLRGGQVRVDGKRVEASFRLGEGGVVRVPPMMAPQPALSKKMPGLDADVKDTRAYLRAITLHEDDDILIFNKPYGLAVQGGSGLSRHLDGMLRALTDRKGQMPRLVHRLDRETSGVITVAKNRRTAAALGELFKSRDVHKTYWALVRGVPKPAEGEISSFLLKDKNEEGDDKMRLARHGERGAQHAVSRYRVMERAAQKLSWLELEPVTGRTHQLRVHCAELGCPILADSKYFNVENWELPGGIQNRLHLHARRIRFHAPSGKKIDVEAPLPPHMLQSWNLLGFGKVK